MEANFKGSNTVAWCVKEVAEIMTKAGFKLPQQVDFCLIDENEKNPLLGV